jgi:putative ABC transport system permease protein
VINEEAARRYFPGKDPIGGRLRFSTNPGGKSAWVQVVGVVADAKAGRLDDDPRLGRFEEYPEPESFELASQLPLLSGRPNDAYGSVSLLVRFNSPAMMTAEQFRNEIARLDHGIAVFNIEPMDNIVSRTIARPRFNLLLLGIFAAIAFPLAIIGVYGLVSYSTAQRTREMGIRAALGAGQRDILALVVRQGCALALTGVGIGLGLSLVLTRLVSSLLYGVSPLDATTFAFVTLLISSVAALASYVPARRATRVDPMRALRTE